MQMTVTVSAELFEQLKRIQDLESTRRQKPVTLEEAIQAAAETHLYKNDPIQKAQRAQPTKSVAAVPGTSLGHRTAVPIAITHEVMLRDADRCTAQTPQGRCQSRRWLRLHHNQFISKGGLNTPENLALLCSAHHAVLHGRRKVG